MDYLDWVFVACAVTSLVSAGVVVTRRNPVYSVIFMLPLFLAMAVLFVFLAAPFLAAMQIMVYGGALMVVFLFVIMLINLQPSEMVNDANMYAHIGSAAVCGGLCGGMIAFLRRGVTPEMEASFAAKTTAGAKTTGILTEVEFGSIKSLGIPLFQNMWIPFELVSLLIISALVGAVLLAKKRV